MPASNSPVLFARAGRGLQLRSSRLALATALVAASVVLPGAADAQSAPPSAVRESVDANGVDLFSGQLTVTGPALTLGSDDNGLKYYRWNKGAGWSDNISAYLNQSGSTMTVSLGDRSDRFSVSGTTFTPTEGNGATLVLSSGTYTYTAADGTVAHFSAARHNSWNGYSNQGLVSDIVSPSGETLSFGYDTIAWCTGWDSAGEICRTSGRNYGYRLASVTSSYGYRIAMTHGSYSWSDDPNYPEDPANPEAVPDLSQWTAVTGVTGHNLAANPSTALASQSFGVTTSGGVTSYTVTDAASGQTKFRQGSSGEVTGVTLPGHTSEDVTINYTSGVVSSVVKAGGTTGYSRSDSSTERTVTVTPPLGGATIYTFNLASQRLVSRSLTESPSVLRTTLFAYDSSGRLTRTTQPEGNYVELTYDSRGNVTQMRAVDKTGVSSSSDIVTSAGYDTTCSNPKTCNQPNSTTDARGNVTDYTYDATHGGVLTVTAPAPTTSAVRPQLRYGYTSLQAYFDQGSGIVASGQPVYRLTSVSMCRTTSTCTGTADERVQTVSYGPQSTGTGNNLLPVSTTEAAGNATLTRTTALEYDAVGNLIAVDGPQSGTADKSIASYDALRRPEWTIGPDPDGTGTALFPATKYLYRADSQIDKVESGAVTAQSSSGMSSSFSRVTATETSYDSAYRPTRQSVLDASSGVYQVTDLHYDSASRIECVIVRMNPSTWSTVASSCSPGTGGTYGPDRVTYNTYDGLGRVSKVTSGYGISGTQADDVTTTFSANGQVATVTDAEGNKTSYSYDGHDRLVQTNYPSTTQGAGTSSSSDYEQIGYDPTSNVTSFRTRRAETLNMTYDNLDRLTVKDVPARTGLDGTHTRDVYFAYDLFGDMTDARFGSLSGEGIVNAFDALGQLTSTTTNLDSVSRVVSFGYDVAGNRTSMSYPDSVVVNYHRHASSGGLDYADLNGTSSLFRSTQDAAGRPAALQRWSPSASAWNPKTGYDYDGVSRLSYLGHGPSSSTTFVESNFAYNPASQIVSRSNSNDKFAWIGAVNASHPYTANGLNQYSAVAGASYTYDANGNLISDGARGYTYDVENRLVGRSGGGTSTTLRYDPLGRLYETVGSSTGTTRFLYNGDDLVAEYDGSGTLLRRYVHGPGAGDDPLVWFEGSGVADSARRYLYADERGSIMAVTDGSGTATSINTYDEYGTPGSSNTGRFQFTGQAWIPELGLYYYKARMYSPKLGRFMQTDPIGYGDGMNMYAYVHGDPVNGADPSGLATPTTAPNDGGCLPDPEIHNIGECRTAPITVVGTLLDSTHSFCGRYCGLIASIESSSPDASGPEAQSEIVVTAPQRASLARRIYRWFVPDPCRGRGTNEGFGVPADYDPYEVAEGRSLDKLYSHVLPDHDWSEAFSDSAFLTGAILTTIQTPPARGSGGAVVYTVNTGRTVGFDKRWGKNSDYITVVMGPKTLDERALVTAYPGCR